MFNFTTTKIINLSTILTTTLGLLSPVPLLAQNIKQKSDFTQPNSHFQTLTPTQLFKQPTLIAQRQDNRKRVALIIGNASYPSNPLKNPVNDATDISATLKQLGFEVILVKNANLKQVNDALDQFYRKLSQGSVGLFYYAGHGIQVNGENYLIPTDAKLSKETDTAYETLPLGKVLDAMYEAQSDVRIVILDACRDNPFARNWRTRSSSQTRGLSTVQSKGKGEFIAYATQPGNVAKDGTGRNGVFTTHLLKHLKNREIGIEEVFKLVRQGVAQETNDFQVPYTASGLVGDFYFSPTKVLTGSPPTTPNSNSQSTTPTPEPETIIPRNLTIIAAKPNQSEEEMFERLEQFLAQQDFRNADEQTWELYKQLVNGGKETDLTHEQLRSAPSPSFCSGQSRMDDLWLKYSEGKFGFSVQSNIWESIKRNSSNSSQIEMQRRFAISVGWKTGSDQDSKGYVGYENLNFTNTAKEGHLP